MSESIEHNQSNNSKAGEAQNRQITVDDSMTLMQEVRTAALKKGCNVIQAEGVPNNIDLSSIELEIKADKPCRIVSSSSRAAEKMNRQRALTELIGKEVLLLYTTPFKLQTYNGKLLFVDGETVGIQRPNGKTMIAKLSEALEVVYLLKDLREMPALEFEIESDEDQEVELSVLFESHNSFKCPITHNIVFDDRDAVIRSLKSNSELTNRTGCDWSNVTIKIMTGSDEGQQNSRAKSSKMVAMSARSYAMDEAVGGSAPTEAESVGERKLFELPPGISLKNGDTKLIPLLSASSIPVTVEYYISEGTFENAAAQLKLSFKNLACEKSSGLGKPIPAGTARVYQLDKSGKRQLTSRNVAVPDTSIGGVVELELGSTQDIKATRRLVDQDRKFVDKSGKPLNKEALANLEKAQAAVNNRRWTQQMVRVRQSFEVVIENFKDKEVAVSVLQSLGIGQKILSPSTKFVTDKSRSKAVVSVSARTQKAAGKATLTYVVETLQEENIQIGDLPTHRYDNPID